MKLSDITEKSIAQLVRDTNISRSTLADIYKGITELKSTSLENAVVIAKALDMSVDELYNKLYSTKNR